MDKKTSLATETALVEDILRLSNDPTKLSEAQDLSLKLLRAQGTGHFSAVDVNEYVSFRRDLAAGKGDYERIAKACRETLTAIAHDLGSARRKLSGSP
ncbi:MAG TPA: hypothetical protein VK978_02715 [Candidatus Saccharimonadales bacterium]|nr:hypothetical protein [Candidatus Saccharimonadales bacterium]